MKVTRHGNEMDTVGEAPKVGAIFPTVIAYDENDQAVTLPKNTGKKLLLSVVPSINTRVCSIETKRFNMEADNFKEVEFITVSDDSKEDQKNWCAAEGVTNLQLLHADKGDFAEITGLDVPEFGHMARMVFILDETGRVIYEELVTEISSEPDYAKLINELKK
ncbi:thiol peroxidase [Dellaglioa carnosa]|uniref:Peroxiredoxin n=1 Tax=Dellaglioa carnosa TaxID=2995136 RepID=A0ABT4JK36_9LACO|nr:peroxiredoxin [Dellaglioa carnosa]MCZ2490734.1 peroxiredoxin [Dellaglioa carnosa]MCZ2493812.1 peroxiredoxin [Dellaglioa carnosa]MDK1730676.1 peroxiredoxin [Dellaglioa carnosa]